MDSLLSQQGAITPGPGPPTESDIFATLHHLVSRIDAESRVGEAVEKAQGLNTGETQLLVDVLSTALDKDAAPLKTRVYVWRTLIRIASSARVIAQNRTLKSEYTTPEASPGIFKILGNAPTLVKAIQQTKYSADALYSKSLISWAHLSHPNILPLYAIFLEGHAHPSLVSPYAISGGICDYAQAHPEAPCMPLVSDVVNGLSYIHQLDMVHGGLNPDSVLVSKDGRALIADLDASDSPPVRYSAPELLADEEIQPTKAVDVWSFACLCYELLSGAVPFYHISKEFKVSVAIAGGNKPNRPGHGTPNESEIGDAVWQILLMCWEFRPDDRPTSLVLQQMFLGMDIQDDRPATGPILRPEVTKGPVVDLEHWKDCLTSVLGTDYSPSLRVPEHLRKSLSSFVPDTVKLNATAAAAKKLGPNDTQTFVDFLDLMLEDFPTSEQEPFIVLLSSIMVSTHVIPRCYKLNGVQYEPTPLWEGAYAKAHKARGLNARVNAVTNPGLVKAIITGLSDWAHVSHPNIIPFLGVFQEGGNESPRLFVLTPLWANGNLEDYALTLAQKSRIVLICDVIKGIAHLHSLGIGFGYGIKGCIMVSDEGRAVLIPFGAFDLFGEEADPSTREIRFRAPNARHTKLDQVWSFGCLCYTLLSRKLPYYQYTEDEEIRSAVSRGELPKRPDPTDNEMDEIDDKAWDLITKCCQLDSDDRSSASEIIELLVSWEIEDDRLEAKGIVESGPLAMRSRPNVDFHHVESLLSKIQVELLRSPLSKLLQNHIKDVARVATALVPDDTRILADFLDLALKEHLSISEEQNRVLALLSRITSSTHIFPRRYELKGIKYNPRPMAEGGYGKVYRGTDINVCVKVMTQVDPEALTPWIRELILWAHSSHQNILPFYGVLLEGDSDSHQICLVSPFMKNGNLHHYAPLLSQKSRLPLISDVINGLHYLHVLGIIHSDLKGENVLISNEGRALITDFGTTQITTATVTATASLVPTTLRFAAPEVVLTSGPPTKERDIWSFGCLCYEVLSRQLPYYQYAQTVQVSAALARKELPKRPGSADRNVPDEADENEWDDDDEDRDEIDDPAWSLITKCCAPEPGDRLKTPAIRELITDMKIWDDRPAAKTVPGAEISKLRANPVIDLNHVGELLDTLQKEVVPTQEDGELSFVDMFNSLSQ